MGAPELSSYFNAKEGDGRAYYNPVTETRAPSVTTVLKYEAKDLTGWAAYKTAEFYAKNPLIALERSESSAINAGRGYYKQFRDDRAEVGTGVHETVEAEHTGSWNFPVLDAEQERIMLQWRLFNDVYEIKPVYSEIILWNHTHQYAGTADGLWWVRGPATNWEWVLLWIDLKTSKSMWPGHWMQGAALRNAEKLMLKGPERPGSVYYKSQHKDVEPGWWTEEPMPATEGFAIVHLREDKWDFILGEDEDLYWQEFLCYRTVYDLAEQHKLRAKAKEA